MPHTSSSSSRPRQDDRDRAAKAQEQEFKRARGAISCAECRRLKLKCDKTVPCSSCKRRGCSSICPNGSLTTGQGTRFILADTDRLHGKIAEMSDRIRQLEDALSILQSSVAREPHPLMRRDLLKIKSGLELHAAMNTSALDTDEPAEEDEESQYIDVFGTLALRDDGAATFYGRSAGSESLLLDEKVEPEETTSPPASNGLRPLPDRIMRLVSSFPSAPSSVPDDDLPELIGYLPPWPRAAQLCDLYLEQAPWFFGAVTRRQLVEEVLPLFFPEAAVPEAFSTTSAAFNLQHPRDPAGGASRCSSHDLSLVFVVFCFGALTDSALPPAPHNVEAERYFQLARAALNLEPVLERPPSIVTVQTLSLMAIYQGLIADEHSIESTWALMGLSSKLAQSVGLHRDCARWKLSPAEVQKRRALFWELFITDCWQSLATGRLPTFSLPFVDTELPGDPDETIAEDGSVQPGFPAWKARWGKECVADVVQGTLTSRAPKYTVILELDRKLRDLPLPKYAQGPPPRGVGLRETMLHFMPINYRELTLLYVHRCFFAQALSDHPTDPLRSAYAPSFLAGYRSACALLSTVREQFAMFPVQIARFWVLWTHAFSSSVMLASVVTHGGTTKTAQAALGELRLAYDLFEKAAKHGGRAVKFLPIVRRLHDKAYRSYTQGVEPRRDIFTARTTGDEQPDELSIFSGRTRTVATKSKTSPAHRARSVSRRRPGPHPTSGASSNAPTPPDSGGSASGSGSGRDSLSPQSAPVEAFPALESYGSVMHPMLVDQMRTFQGELDDQINNTTAYYIAAAPEQPQFDTWYPAPDETMPPPPPPAAQHYQYHASQPVSAAPQPTGYAAPHAQQMYEQQPAPDAGYYQHAQPDPAPTMYAADQRYTSHLPAGDGPTYPGPAHQHPVPPPYYDPPSHPPSRRQSTSLHESRLHQVVPPLAVLPGAYSLQEAWTSFMQAELPTPVSVSQPRYGP